MTKIIRTKSGATYVGFRNENGELVVVVIDSIDGAIHTYTDVVAGTANNPDGAGRIVVISRNDVVLRASTPIVLQHSV